MQIIKQKDRALETVLVAERLAAQAEEATAKIGKTENVNSDQDEVSAMIYEELLAAQETIAAQKNTISALKGNITSLKNTIAALNDRIEKFEAVETVVPVDEVESGKDLEENPVTDEEVSGNE